MPRINIEKERGVTLITWGKTPTSDLASRRQRYNPAVLGTETHSQREKTHTETVQYERDTYIGTVLTLAERYSLVEGFAQRDCAILCGVVIIDVQVARASELQVQVTVLGHRMQHVI